MSDIDPILPTWWALSGDDLMDMLREVQAGADPEIVYMEHYANSDIETIKGEDS